MLSLYVRKRADAMSNMTGPRPSRTGRIRRYGLTQACKSYSMHLRLRHHRYATELFFNGWRFPQTELSLNEVLVPAAQAYGHPERGRIARAI
jgi:hypothetical protein